MAGHSSKKGFNPHEKNQSQRLIRQSDPQRSKEEEGQRVRKMELYHHIAKITHRLNETYVAVL